MKRSFWVVPMLVIVVATTHSSVLGYQPVIEETSSKIVDQGVHRERPDLEALQVECAKMLEKMKSTVKIFVKTVVTVAKAMINAIHTVLAAIVKLIVRFALAVVWMAARLILGLFLPV